MLPPSLGLKNKPSKKQYEAAVCFLHAGFFLGLLLKPENSGEMFL
jgi:hypothetical protein